MECEINENERNILPSALQNKEFNVFLKIITAYFQNYTKVKLSLSTP
jgi:hypothetical protein